VALIRRRAAAVAGPAEEDAETETPGEELQPVGVPEADDGLKATSMRGTEPLYGYVVALELIVVAILNLTVTKGVGAPAKPSTGMGIIGLVAAAALLVVMRTRHRTAVAFSAIIAAFFVTLPKVPNSLKLAHVVALIFPVIYALILTQRQRRALGVSWKQARRGGPAARRSAQTGAGRTSGARAAARTQGARSARAGRATADTAGRSRRGGTPASTASGPTASRRYTPPKGRRGGPRR
jgi:hypothetical protein